MNDPDVYGATVKFTRRRLVAAIEALAAPIPPSASLTGISVEAESLRRLAVAESWAVIVAALDTGSPAGWRRDIG